MNWGAERWRKLYTRLSPSWLALPVLTRGLGAELLKYADDDGRIPLHDEEPCEAIVRIVAAHKKEREAVAAAAESLIREGYLVVEPGRIVIRNFVEAQARGTGADRQARYRSKARGVDSDVTEGVTGPVTGDASLLRNEVTDRALPLPLSGSGSDSDPSQHPDPREAPETARTPVAATVPPDAAPIQAGQQAAAAAPHPAGVVSATTPRVEAIGPGTVPQSPGEVLAELRKHPVLAQVATERTAEVLLGRAITGAKRLSWVAEAIADCARDAAAADAAESPWGATTMIGKLSKYVDRSRAPKPAQQGSQAAWRSPKRPGPPAPAAPDVEAANKRQRMERIEREQAAAQALPVSEVPFL